MPEADVTVTATIKAPTASIYIQAHSATYAGQTHYWATFFSNEGNYRLPAGAQAFTINRSKSNDKAMYRLGDGSVIPAGCAVVIMADMETIHLTLTDATATPQADNKLLGVGTDTAKASLITGNKKVYVMGVSGGIFGFHVFSGTTVPANKAFYVE